MDPSKPLSYCGVEIHPWLREFLAILTHYTMYDKILTYALKHLDALSNALDPIARQDEAIRMRWSITEQYVRGCADLKSDEEMVRRPSPNEKGWVLRVSRIHPSLLSMLTILVLLIQCRCATVDDTQLLQCAGCEVVRYCSKQCQRDSWKSHHKLSCKFLKAAVGECFEYIQVPARDLHGQFI
jgi:hypothetical protein